MVVGATSSDFGIVENLACSVQHFRAGTHTRATTATATRAPLAMENRLSVGHTIYQQPRELSLCNILLGEKMPPRREGRCNFHTLHGWRRHPTMVSLLRMRCTPGTQLKPHHKKTTRSQSCARARHRPEPSRRATFNPRATKTTVRNRVICIHQTAVAAPKRKQTRARVLACIHRTSYALQLTGGDPLFF